MKTLVEIKEFCQTRCLHIDCRGKDLKLAKRSQAFCGIALVRKGQYYCDHLTGNKEHQHHQH